MIKKKPDAPVALLIRYSGFFEKSKSTSPPGFVFFNVFLNSVYIIFRNNNISIYLLFM